MQILLSENFHSIDQGGRPTGPNDTRRGGGFGKDRQPVRDVFEIVGTLRWVWALTVRQSRSFGARLREEEEEEDSFGVDPTNWTRM